ncbi:PREDICTED: mitochondrial import receptor subunit TOM22 homolog [Priapulus caudatus]|uniref:Mitochondrial import receptor subunit TOM22 homolog n=1 Tax=Priapulus caudatus TaxID=37621 RepID=A0ABM1F8Z4_PRICU|nr:PREDICTED: mitochondrial import receptor subunit TOM22 homolog [Priapulus caudatus]
MSILDDTEDSGLETMSMNTPDSHEEPPKLEQEAGQGDPVYDGSIKATPAVPHESIQPRIPQLVRDDEEEGDDDDEDESAWERLVGLTEMFPPSLRSGVSSLVTNSVGGLFGLYGVSRTVMWILVSSSTVLMAPVIFEMERSQMEQAQLAQQRQILLGPSAAVSGQHAMHGGAAAAAAH